MAKVTSNVQYRTLAGTGKFNWLLIIAVGWALLFGASMYERYRPSSDWFQIHTLQVEDTVVGKNPIIKYNRTIEQPFRGHWIAEVQYMQPTGLWVAECIATGDANYSPDKSPPDPLKLNWLTYPIDCAPKNTGKYRLSTSLTIELPGGLTKQVFANSNTFNVTE